MNILSLSLKRARTFSLALLYKKLEHSFSYSIHKQIIFPDNNEDSKMTDFKLKPLESLKNGRKPVLICIMDGVGVGPKDAYDARHLANPPTLNALEKVPGRFRTIVAHGKAVGLPDDDSMGNSEVGHNNLGVGRVFAQGALLVDNALASGAFFQGAGWNYLKEGFNVKGSTLHMIGLLSNGGVHSRYDQMLQILKGAAQHGATSIRMHILLDGRDVPDGTSIKFTQDLENDLADIRAKSGGKIDAKIASGGGRMFVTMDRYEADWSIVERGWHAHVLGKAQPFTSAVDAVTTLKTWEGKNVSDQYLLPFVITDDKGIPVGTIKDGDSVMLFNYRGDRMIEISKAFEYGSEFDKFNRIRVPNVRFVGMMTYDGDLNLPKNSLVAPPLIQRTSGEYLAKNGIRTFACSETQKFGHVTYFWNGNRSGKFDENLETYCEIPSDRVQFNQKPAMKALEIATAAADALRSGKYDIVRVNIANGDMVGHTGDLHATVTAVQSVDEAVKKMIAAVNDVGGSFLITADHGNCDDMVQRDKKGKPLKNEKGELLPLTSHTLAPVPVYIGGPNLPENLVFADNLPNAGLANVTATFINLLGFEAPSDYEPSLLSFKSSSTSKL